MTLRIRKSKIQNRKSRGFSLPEVMFAIMILGIGFIMVAAMFPVAMQQAKDSHDETTAAEVVKSAVNIIQNGLNAAPANEPLPTADLYAQAENVLFWRNATYGIRGSVIYEPDPRYAWTALYCRRAGAPFIQVAIFVISSTDGRPFTAADVVPPASGVPNLWPRRVEIQVLGTTPDQVVVRKDTTGTPLYDARGAVVENAYLLAENGDTFRIASYVGPGAVADTDVWQLYPGQGVTPKLPAVGTWAKAWLIGKRVVPSAVPPTFEGTAQDIALYSTNLRAN